MKRFVGKLRFIHRRMWHQDGGYRVALMLGPAPLLGAVLAAALWGTVVAVREVTYQPPSWAVPQGSKILRDDAGHPLTVQPARPLPEVGADGGLIGHEPGWNVVARPIQVSQTMDVDIETNPLAGFAIKGPSVDMEQILAAGLKASLYIAVGTGSFVVRQPGVYAFSVRFERPPGPIADCLMRLGFGPHRVLSHLNLSAVSTVSLGYETAWFDLRPGLYPIAWAFGCWHGNEVIGPGRMTILVSHPGESTLSPTRPDDIVQ
jgi:hypothetical protein